MSHLVFHTAQIPSSTAAAAAKTLPLKPAVPPVTQLCPRQQLPAPQLLAPKVRKNLAIRCSSSSTVDGGEFGPVMKGNYGAFGAVTLEKGKLDLTQESKFSPEVN